MAPAPYTAIFMPATLRQASLFYLPPLRGKVARRAGRGVCQCSINRFSYFDRMLEHIDVEEPQDSITTCFEPARSILIPVNALLLEMACAVQFDDQLCFRAEEVRRISANRCLTTKAE